MKSRLIVPATGSLGFALLLLSCHGGVGACGRANQGTPAASAAGTSPTGSSGRGTPGQLPASTPIPAGTLAPPTKAPPPAPPPGLGTLGELPTIAPVPAGTPDAAAAVLAKQVLAGDAGSLSALLRAIDLAGFTIQHAGRTVQAPSGASQGIVFQAWEVQALSKLMRDGLATSFGEAAALFAMTTKETSTVPFETLMYDGIRTSATAKNPALRFWAKFIVELGFQGPGAYDLLSDKTLARVNMDPVQIAFIFKRLAGDLAVFARNHAPKVAKTPDIQPALWTGSEPLLVFASHRLPSPIDTLINGPLDAHGIRPAPPDRRDPRSDARSAPWDGDGEAPSPCALEGVEKEISDWGAALDNVGYGLLMGRLEKEWGFAEAERISKATGVANMALAYLKLAATWALFNARITMTGQARRSREPGPPRRTANGGHWPSPSGWITATCSGSIACVP